MNNTLIACFISLFTLGTSLSMFADDDYDRRREAIQEENRADDIRRDSLRRQQQIDDARNQDIEEDQQRYEQNKKLLKQEENYNRE